MRTLIENRVRGTYTVDEWGLDAELVSLLSPVFAARWSISAEGSEHVPAEGPAVVVANRRFGVSEPFVLSRGLRLATGRHVRLAGAPDIAPLGPAVRRLGAVLARPDEIAGLLRAGELVGLVLAPSPRHRHHAGGASAELLAPALDLGVPIVPVALIGREIGRNWRLIAGAPVEPKPDQGRGPLAAAELADQARGAVQAILDDIFPPSWLRVA